MDKEFIDLLEPRTNEPRTKALSIPVTESDLERYRKVGALVKKANKGPTDEGKNTLPACAHRHVMNLVDQIEKWALDKIAAHEQAQISK